MTISSFVASSVSAGCTGGAANAPGCYFGQAWCADPRCHPFCPGCLPKPFHGGATSALIWLLVLAFFLGFFISLAVALASNGKGEREIDLDIQMG